MRGSAAGVAGWLCAFDQLWIALATVTIRSFCCVDRVENTVGKGKFHHFLHGVTGRGGGKLAHHGHGHEQGLERGGGAGVREGVQADVHQRVGLQVVGVVGDAGQQHQPVRGNAVLRELALEAFGDRLQTAGEDASDCGSLAVTGFCLRAGFSGGSCAHLKKFIMSLASGIMPCYQAICSSVQAQIFLILAQLRVRGWEVVPVRSDTVVAKCRHI